MAMMPTNTTMLPAAERAADHECGPPGSSPRPTKPVPARSNNSMQLMVFMIVAVLCRPILVCHAQVDGTTTGSTGRSDAEILQAVYDATGGPRWQNSDNWLSSSSSTTTVCNYAGITCYNASTTNDARRYGHIQMLDVSSNHLVGVVPSVVFELPYLESLVLRDNPDVSIELAGIGRALYLKTLVLSNTNVLDLDGIQQAPELEVLHITNLGLTGPFPLQIFGLVHLQALFANFNRLTGPLPTQIGNLRNLQELYLYENELSGQLPTQLGMLHKLETLSMAQNHFSGTLPTQLEQLTALQTVALHRAHEGRTGSGISGKLLSFANMPGLTELYLEHQALTGTIPYDFFKQAPPTEVLQVDLSHNQLSGTIPVGLATKRRLNFYVNDNHITGVPSTLCGAISNWMGGAVGSLGTCDAFLCPIGTVASQGRATSTESCSTCTVGTPQYFGQSDCGGAQDQRAVLVDFYNQMDGPNWKNAQNWLNLGTSVCEWFGVECNGGQVMGLALSANGLSGIPPPDLYKLPMLRSLNLSSNSIEIDFAAVGQSSTLEELDLANCDLTSVDGIRSLVGSNLKVLNLSMNRLTGQIPTPIFAMEKLQELDVSHNAFSGPLSPSIGALVKLRRLAMSGNRLSGQIPAQIGVFSQLVELHMEENAFGGTLPTSLNRLTQLEELLLHQVKSGGSIGGSLLAFESLSMLSVLTLDGNALNGTLPADLLANTVRGSELVEIGLSDNKLQGQVPGAWATRFSSLRIDLSGNEITSIADAACKATGWEDGKVEKFKCLAILCPKGTYNDLGRQTSTDGECMPCPSARYLGARECDANGDAGSNGELDLLMDLYDSTNGNSWNNSSNWGETDDVCTWHGIICNAAGNVIEIDLRNNGLTGKPANSIFALLSLRALRLGGNAIKFPFGGIGRAKSLSVLDLSGTGLDSIDGIAAAGALTELHVTDNDLQGSFPDQLLILTNLRSLYMNYNKLEGRIPEQITSLFNLQELFLFNNQLSGQIPATLGSLSNLVTLALSENNIYGSIPTELLLLTKLEVLAIQREGGKGPDSVGVDQGAAEDEGTGLTGPLLAFHTMPSLKELYLGSNSLSGTIPANFLDGVSDKTVPIEVDLISNRLTGGIPSSLAQFEQMTLFVAGNRMKDPVPEGICQNSGWMSGGVGTFQCRAILCPPNTISAYGRQADSMSGCQSCPSGETTVFYGSFDCLTSAEQQAVDEREILEALYIATDGRNWKHQDGWLEPDTSVCEYHGITCAGGDVQSVHSIQLSHNALEGTIPSSIFDLPNLVELNLGGNDIEMTFEAIGSAPKLEYLDLDDVGLTSLSGIGAAQNLKLLHVDGNDFEGGFPDAILSLGALEVLYMSRTNVGSIPSTISNLSNLLYFSCAECRLGNLPAEILAGLTKLEYLDLAQNDFDRIDFGLLRLTSLKHLDLSEQMSLGDDGIAAQLPSFSNFTKLTELSLQGNQFHGAIPSDFLQNVNPGSSIVTVDLRLNRLTGTIPSSLSRFSRMNLYLADNMITSIPQSLCSLRWNDRPSMISGDGCDFLLCPIGTFSGLGRAVEGSPCTTCKANDEAQYFGSTACAQNEREALLEIFRTLDGSSWLRSDGWGSGTDACSWFGVSCFDSGSRIGLVRSIELPNNSLAGSVSDSIWSFTHMEELDLRQNGVSVSFGQIRNAHNLKVLVLSETLVKSIDSVGAATSLVELHLTSNNINGTIPEELYNMRSLQQLYMNYNQLTGTLSTRIGQLQELRELYLFNNNLKGTLPESIGNLRQIKVFSLGENTFTGTIPTAFSYFQDLEVLALQNEKLDVEGPYGLVDGGYIGTVPTFSRSKKLREVYLSTNSLGGTLPSDFLRGIADKSAPLHVDLSFNRIHGTIPASLTVFSDLRLFMSGNQISGVPNAICAQEDWFDGIMATSCDAFLCPPGTFSPYGRQVAAQGCEVCDYVGPDGDSIAVWYGTTKCGAVLSEFYTQEDILDELYDSTGGPSWKDSSNWGKGNAVCSRNGITCQTSASGEQTVTAIDLSNNGLVNHIPSIIFYLPSLRSLNVADNTVSMTFRDIKAAQHLQAINFSSTDVVKLGGLGGASSLKHLKMGNNAFYGQSLPDELYDLYALEDLDFSSSGFIGTLSPAIGQLTNLLSLAGHQNDLTGPLPSEIGKLRGLKTLDLSDNRFHGVLPWSVTNMTSLQNLFIHSRSIQSGGLSGALPSFANLPNIRRLDLGSNALTGTIPANLLAGVSDPTARIDVFVDSNLLYGQVPSELSRLPKLNIHLEGNKVTGIGDGLCDETQWLLGSVGQYSCDAILCPPGMYNPDGRQSSSDDKCQECPDAVSSYWGSLYCPSLIKKENKEILVELFHATGGTSWKRRDGWLNDNVDICDWHGVSCTKDVEIETVNLGGNNVIGTVPSSIFRLRGLKYLWLYSNPVDINFAGIANATSLASLQLDSTSVSTLNGIGGAPALTYLDVRFNKLSGSLSRELDGLVYLETLLLGDNSFNEPVPDFSSNRRLTTVRARRNGFTGVLPAFDLHPSLHTIDLSSNELHGEIPETFLAAADTSKPVFLDFSENHLSGNLPKALARFDEMTLYVRDNEISSINPDLCRAEAWNGGDVETFGCDGILCPPRTSSPNGRASPESPCTACKAAAYFGSTVCDGGSGALASYMWPIIAIGLSCVTGVYALLL